MKADWVFVALLSGCLATSCFVVADQPVHASVVVQECLTKSQGDVYREVNATIRRTIDKRNRTAIADLDWICLGDKKLVEATASGYRAAGWKVERHEYKGSTWYIFEAAGN